MEILTAILAVLAIITYIIRFIKGIDKPNTDQDKEIVAIKKDIDYMSDELCLLKENHIAHIENDINFIKGELIKINTILNTLIKK
jgi:hypothetical protein